MSETPWYRELFGEDYLRLWEKQMPAERTAREVDGVVALLDLPPGSRILDLCCGHGRHSVPLARRGYRVTGLDLSPVFLEHARAAAKAADVEVEWVESDMRAIPFEGRFDAVVNLFTAFGYLESAEEDRKVLEQVRRALKPGGRFLIEFLHRDALTARYRPHSVERFPDGLIVLNEGEWDLLDGSHRVRMTLIYPDGRRREYRHSVRLYAACELARMLGAAGLEVEAVHGGMDGSPLTLESRRLAMVARRPEEES